MTESAFRPIVTLKDCCPWCFRFRLFLLEAGLQDQFDLRMFVPGDAQEEQIRAELAAHFDTVTFPTVEVAPGQFLADSAALVAHYADHFGIAVDRLALLDQYERGPLATIGRLFGELRALRQNA
jgi:glutathione S-transferase